MDTNAKISGLRSSTSAQAIISSAISVQGPKLVHFKAPLLVLFEQLMVETILSIDLLLESLYLTLVPLRTQL